PEASMAPGPEDIVLGRERSPGNGPVSMATGGTMTVGPDGTVASSYMEGTSSVPSFDNEGFQALRRAQRANQGLQLDAQGNLISARQGQLPYQYAVLGAR